MDYVGAIIGVLGTILGGVLSYAAFHRNSKKDSESEGKEAGTMLTEIGYIKGGIDRIERKQDAQDARYISMAERMSAVESSAKSAHHRIDRLDTEEPAVGESVNEVLEICRRLARLLVLAVDCRLDAKALGLRLVARDIAPVFV